MLFSFAPLACLRFFFGEYEENIYEIIWMEKQRWKQFDYIFTPAVLYENEYNNHINSFLYCFLPVKDFVFTLFWNWKYDTFMVLWFVYIHGYRSVQFSLVLKAYVCKKKSFTFFFLFNLISKATLSKGVKR